MNHDDIVEFSGIKFRVDTSSSTHRRLVPVEDSDWLNRIIQDTLSSRPPEKF